MKKVLTRGDQFNGRRIEDLLLAVFNRKNPYISFYSKPRLLQKYVKGGFYIMIIEDIPYGWCHKLYEKIVWNVTVSNTRDAITRRFVGETDCLAEKDMDLHGHKILVFLDKRKKEKCFEFFGVFGEREIFYQHNKFKGIEYVRLADCIEYEYPEQKTAVPDKPKRRALKTLIREKEFTEILYAGMDKTHPELYKEIQKRLDNLNAEIERLQKYKK